MKLRTLLKTLDRTEFKLLRPSGTWLGEGANDWLSDWLRLYTEDEVMDMKVLTIRTIGEELFITLK